MGKEQVAGPIRAPASKAMGTERLPQISDTSSMPSPTRCVWESFGECIRQTDPCQYCPRAPRCKVGTSFVRAVEEVPKLAMRPEKPKDGVRAENNFHINVTRAGWDAPMVRFSMKRHVLLSKTFHEHGCKLDRQCQQKRPSSHNCRGRMDIELRALAAGRRDLPRPDDSNPVFSPLPFPLLHIKPLMHVHKRIAFLFFYFLLHGQ